MPSRKDSSAEKGLERGGARHDENRQEQPEHLPPNDIASLAVAEDERGERTRIHADHPGGPHREQTGAGLRVEPAQRRGDTDLARQPAARVEHAGRRDQQPVDDGDTDERPPPSTEQSPVREAEQREGDEGRQGPAPTAEVDHGGQHPHHGGVLLPLADRPRQHRRSRSGRRLGEAAGQQLPADRVPGPVVGDRPAGERERQADEDVGDDEQVDQPLPAQPGGGAGDGGERALRRARPAAATSPAGSDGVPRSRRWRRHPPMIPARRPQAGRGRPLPRPGDRLGRPGTSPLPDGGAPAAAWTLHRSERRPMSTNQMSSTPVPSVPGAARPRDVRTFWRVLLAVLAPLPMVGMGAYYLLSPIDGGASFESTVGAYAADPDRPSCCRTCRCPSCSSCRRRSPSSGCPVGGRPG